tara:strand:+ start:521 stop:898 length:378 start_codon:yes stop_codon:yes gene_type:complete
MSLVDDIFKDLPLEILTDFGQDITLVKTVTPRAYNPSTGAVTGADTTVVTKGFIGNISSREADGLYQTTDLRITVSGDDLNSYYPTQADRIRYTQGGVTREAKILNVTTYRGEDPLLHIIIARPQ